jgi:5-methylcytosine-specific restriction endonuclease McrA
MKAYEIAGGYAHICDCCEIDDGRPTLYWEKRDFDLCYECLKELYKENIVPGIVVEKIKVVRKTISEDLRNEVFKRDGYKCQICGSKKDLVLDHIKPFSMGGRTEIDNLQTLCKSCNSQKGSKY